MVFLSKCVVIVALTLIPALAAPINVVAPLAPTSTQPAFPQPATPPHLAAPAGLKSAAIAAAPSSGPSTALPTNSALAYPSLLTPGVAGDAQSLAVQASKVAPLDALQAAAMLDVTMHMELAQETLSPDLHGQLMALFHHSKHLHAYLNGAVFPQVVQVELDADVRDPSLNTEGHRSAVLVTLQAYANLSPNPDKTSSKAIWLAKMISGRSLQAAVASHVFPPAPGTTTTASTASTSPTTPVRLASNGAVNSPTPAGFGAQPSTLRNLQPGAVSAAGKVITALGLPPNTGSAVNSARTFSPAGKAGPQTPFTPGARGAAFQRRSYYERRR